MAKNIVAQAPAKRMTIILDLDNTLFNTKMLKEDIRRVFGHYKVSDSAFWKTLKQSYDVEKSSAGCYSVEKHLSLLPQLKSQNTNIKNDVNAIMRERGASYLYPDVIPFLNKVRSLNSRTVLITLGDPGLQRIKLEVTKLANRFDHISIVTGSKLDVIKNEAAGQPVININDHIDEMLAIQNLARIKNILIQRDEKIKIKFSPFPIIKKLEEALMFIDDAPDKGSKVFHR